MIEFYHFFVLNSIIRIFELNPSQSLDQRSLLLPYFILYMSALLYQICVFRAVQMGGAGALGLSLLQKHILSLQNL